MTDDEATEELIERLAVLEAHTDTTSYERFESELQSLVDGEITTTTFEVENRESVTFDASELE